MPSKYTRVVRIPRPIIIPIGPSLAYVELTQELFALIASYEADRVGEFCWFVGRCSRTGEPKAERSITREDGEQRGQTLHAFLMGTSGRKITADHVVPGNRLNCLPHNLRIATSTQQMANRRMPPNSSGVKGVCWKQKKGCGGGRWIARIQVQGKQIPLGSYTSLEDAKNVYHQALIEHFGEFARLE